jgi:CRP/FNR family transcriptional regulator, anaerobic regulatory protein
MFGVAQTGGAGRPIIGTRYVGGRKILPQPTTAIAILKQPAPSARTGKREVSCARCNLRESCLSGGVPAADLERVANIVYARRRIMGGERLYNAGDGSRCLYAIRTGFFKTSLIASDSREQVTGFFMAGELLGTEGFCGGCYNDSAIALEDSDVCAMPHSLIERIGREVPSLQRRLHAVLAREIVRGHGVMLLLGSMSAEERLATFLLNLARRFQRRGYSGSSFLLRMTRSEIGSYLGLKLETVSRLFSAFHKEGLLDVHHRQVSILDIEGLERLLAG